ncbi:DUF481 domain-containing protein [Microbulbifer sp. ZKSA006]|uniref:DUF481 domain-containing protein n=1 Tax=Microbulbifer sp. ZKSA006 TaxID=3243390 RepID=UPI004039206F
MVLPIRPPKFLAHTLLLLAPLQVQAGVLTLENGDRIQGELILVEKDQVTWQSETFGEVQVDKSKVVSMDIDTDIKIAGRDEPCTLAGHRQERWEVYCAEGRGWLIDFPGIERAEPYTAFTTSPVLLHGDITAGGVFESGNREREDLDANINLDIRHGDFHHLIGSIYQNQDSEEDGDLEKIQLNYDLRWIFSEKWFAVANSKLEREEAQNLDLGTTLGLGMGYLFYDTSKTSFSMEGGLSSLHENFIDEELSEDQDERYVAGRIALNYRYKFSLGPEIYFDQETLQSFDHSNDYEANAKLGVRTPLVEGVLMEIGYEWQYDNTPSLESEKEDSKVTVGVGYEW